MLLKHSKKPNLSVQDGQGDTPLHVAIRFGHTDIAALLIENKADALIRNNQGKLPIHIAAEEGHVETVNLLHSKGFSIEETDKEGNTPLHCAIRKGKEKVATFLLEKGARTDVQNIYGQTPLQLATGGLRATLDQKTRSTTSSKSTSSSNSTLSNSNFTFNRSSEGGRESLSSAKSNSVRASEFDVPLESIKIDSSLIQIQKHPNGDDVVLGSGAYGTVLMVNLVLTGLILSKGECMGRFVAVKVFHSSGIQSEEAVLKEIRNMRICGSHPNVLNLMGVTLNPLRVITELAEKGNLNQWMERTPDSSISIRHRMAQDIVSGLLWLKSKMMAHLDLKAANLVWVITSPN